MLRRKAMHLKWLQAMKWLTPGIIDDIGIKTASLFCEEEKIRKEKISRIYLPIINQEMHVDQEAERLLEI